MLWLAYVYDTSTTRFIGQIMIVALELQWENKITLSHLSQSSVEDTIILAFDERVSQGYLT